MEIGISCEVTSCAAIEELPSILRSQKIRYRVHKSLPTFPILRQINSAHTIPFYLCKIHFNIISPISWSSKQFSANDKLNNAQKIAIQTNVHLYRRTQ
jgi:hypothetical protein